MRVEEVEGEEGEEEEEGVEEVSYHIRSHLITSHHIRSLLITSHHIRSHHMSSHHIMLYLVSAAHSTSSAQSFSTTFLCFPVSSLFSFSSPFPPCIFLLFFLFSYISVPSHFFLPTYSHSMKITSLPSQQTPSLLVFLYLCLVI